MRISGGKFRGRKLNTPTSDHIRPTSDKVRQALFNMLESRGMVDKSVVLDAFCGTGALGIEALSRGAKFCTFMDKDRRSIGTCTQNVEQLGAQEQSKIIAQDTTRLYKKPNTLPRADLVFLDPPYDQGFISLAMTGLEDGDWVCDNVVYIIESEKNFDLNREDMSVLQEKIYKDTKVMIIQKITGENT
ncbi:MAG: 16S rRNA (guanine(966)-N(2))-methyltransferase RsmD [Alphaproteobacteria bacterium]|nr:16S rRNA (guanine(966)-N(2))-methyltransferase RsmD [Alphaproteobacteria bacterium]